MRSNAKQEIVPAMNKLKSIVLPKILYLNLSKMRMNFAVQTFLLFGMEIS